MPLGALIARKSVMDWPKGSHGNTFGGNPISCAAALATIEAIENGYLQNTISTGAYAIDKLRNVQQRHPSIGEVRGLGFMIGVEFVKDRESKKPNEELRDKIVDLSFEHGLLTLGCGKSTIRISPPLCTTKEEIDEGFEIFEEAITIAENSM